MPPSLRRFENTSGQRDRWLDLSLAGRLTSLLILCLGGTGCDGSSGGGGTKPIGAPDPAPVVIAATFVGATSTPTSGDTLQLLFSEDVAILPNTLMTDLDLSLSAGSLGEVTTAPTLKNPRTVLVTLATGVSFEPGTTTLSIGSANDSIRDTTGNNAIASTPVVITDGDGDDPAISVLALSGVDSTLDGSGSAGGTLQVPTSGFTIEVSHRDLSSTVVPADTVIVATSVVGVSGVNRQAGLNLVDAFTHTTSGPTTTYTIPTTVTFPVGILELRVYVRDTTGMISSSKIITGQTRAADDAVRPFETSANASQVWFIDTSRDIESYTFNIFNFITPLLPVSGANGRTDFADLLLIIGLQSTSPIANVSGGKDSNVVAMDLIEAAILTELSALFAGANITFTFTSPGAWVGGSSVAYNSLGFSRIALSGSATAAGTSGTLGLAIFDPNNKNQDDDTQVNYGGTDRLGVFLHTIINDGIANHPTTTFRVTFDPFTPGLFGTVIGGNADDGSRLIGTLNDSRTTEMKTAISRLARFAAVILAHECGHSVGLVMNGAMPAGLYGNDTANFPVFPSSAADGHIKMPTSLFPGLSENIMSPSFDFDATLAPKTRFNTLNRAYLREHVLANGS